MLYFSTCISNFGANSPHWCEAAAGLAMAPLLWIPFQLTWLLVFSSMMKDSSFCRTPLSTSSKTTRTNLSFSLSLWGSASCSGDTSLLVTFPPCSPVYRLQRSDWSQTCPKLTELLEYFHFLQLVRLKTLFSCWPSLGGCLQLLGAYGSSGEGSLLLQRQQGRGLLARWNAILCNIIVCTWSHISHCLCQAPLVRSISQVLFTLKGKRSHKG